MPRWPTVDIAHTALTDHRILRTPVGPLRPRREALPGEIPITSFFARDLLPQDPAATRDLGVALLYQSRHVGPERQQYVARGLPLVEQAVRAFPGDVVARELLGWGRALEGRHEEALKHYEAVLAQVPDREMTLVLAQMLAEILQRPDAALDYTRRLVTIDPWMWEYQFNLARLLAARGDWPAAWESGEAALRLNPADTETRTLFITSCLRTNQADRAETEFQTLLKLNPGDEKKLQDWYAAQR
jgi:tetratricopeptide (TPR) repeat protein